MPNYLINEIQGIENKSYLELGTFDGHHFSSIQAGDKVGIDINPPATFVMTTDEFFKQTPVDKKWDVIYIDADHSWESVLKDFNNSVKHLHPNGCIFLHDLFPDKESLTKPCYCGDAYKFLHNLMRMDYPDTFTLDSDYGVTFIYGPTEPLFGRPLETPSYQDFVKAWPDYKLHSRKEMIKIVKGYYDV